MSPEPLLVLDCNYLCRRAFHTTGSLEHNGKRTGVLFGFFRDLVTLQDQFHTQNIAFCFDCGAPKRQKLLSGYKSARAAKRAAMSAAEKANEQEYYRQLAELQNEHLPAMGWRNILYQKGYEADDLIAMIAQNWKSFGQIIIVSSDHDLFQLLGDGVYIWNPQKAALLTLRWFKQKYQLLPEQWVNVKAIAGCSSDNIPGIPGVGEITALKFLQRVLPADSQAFKKIAHATELRKKNLELVRLPFPGTAVMQPRQDELSIEQWNRVLDENGLGSLHGSLPGHRRRRIAK